MRFQNSSLVTVTGAKSTLILTYLSILKELLLRLMSLNIVNQQKLAEKFKNYYKLLKTFSCKIQ